MALGWSPRLGANHRHHAVLGVSMPPLHPQARCAAADGACGPPALSQRRYSGRGLPCRNSLLPVSSTRVLHVLVFRRAGLLAARAAADSLAGPVTSPRRGRRKATQPEAPPPGPGAVNALEQGAAGGPSPSSAPAVAEHAQREGGEAASQRLLGSSGDMGSGGCSAGEASGEGAVLLGTLRYRKPCLQGPRALRSAFPQQAAAAAVRRVEGGPTKQAVQLHARLPDGQLRAYDVTLCRVGQSAVKICGTRLLAADLGLSEGDELRLYQLPDGRVVAGGTAAAVGAQRILSVYRSYLLGVDAIRQAFPAQAEAALRSKGPQPVRVYSRLLPGGELHPYDLTFYAAKVGTGVLLRLEGISWLVGDLGLQHGDTLRLCAQPDGVVVVEPTHPRPVDPNALPLTEANIRQGSVPVALRIAARLLGGEARRVTGPSMALPVRLEGGCGLVGKLGGYSSKGYPLWRAFALRRWFVACGASPGDTLRLETEDEASASAAEGADPRGPRGPAEGPKAARVGALVARLVRSRFPSQDITRQQDAANTTSPSDLFPVQQVVHLRTCFTRGSL